MTLAPGWPQALFITLSCKDLRGQTAAAVAVSLKCPCDQTCPGMNPPVTCLCRDCLQRDSSCRQGRSSGESVLKESKWEITPTFVFPECGPKTSQLVEIGCHGLPPKISRQCPAPFQSSEESLAVKEDMGMVIKYGLAVTREA